MQNNIEVLYNAAGDKLTIADDIEAEVLNFYHSLLGTAAAHLPSVDISLLRSCPQVQASDAAMLTQPITVQEIEAVGDDKAPRIDGFNSHFFKKAWSIVKHDICAVVLHFFESGVLPEINCTLVTLIPKVLNPFLVKDFRPIACCIVLYKIIAKILTNRM